MSDKNNKIWKIEKSDNYRHLDEYESLEAAQAAAQAAAWSSGHDYWIMGPVGLAKAPVEVNTVQIEKVQ